MVFRVVSINPSIKPEQLKQFGRVSFSSNSYSIGEWVDEIHYKVRITRTVNASRVTPNLEYGISTDSGYPIYKFTPSANGFAISLASGDYQVFATVPLGCQPDDDTWVWG